MQDPSHGEFFHPFFKANCPELLVNIKRKAHNKAADYQRLTMNKKKIKSTVSSQNACNGTINADKDNSRDEVSKNFLFSDNNEELLLLGEEGELFDMAAGNYGGGFGGSSSKSLDKNSKNGAYFIKKLNSGALKRMSAETDAVLNDFVFQKTLREEFEHRLLELESQHERLEQQNALLRGMMIDSKTKQDRMQERMNRILRTLYQFFSYNGGRFQVIRSNGINGQEKLLLSITASGKMKSCEKEIPKYTLGLISALGESNFLDIVEYLKLESPPRSSNSNNNHAFINTFGLDGTALCRLPSFETAASIIAPASISAPSIVSARGGTPLDRMTSLDWPCYSVLTGPSVTSLEIPTPIDAAVNGFLSNIPVDATDDTRTTEGGSKRELGLVSEQHNQSKENMKKSRLTYFEMESSPAQIIVDVKPMSTRTISGNPTINNNITSQTQAPISIAKVLSGRRSSIEKPEEPVTYMHLLDESQSVSFFIKILNFMLIFLTDDNHTNKKLRATDGGINLWF